MSIDLLSGGTFPNFIGVVESRNDPDMRRRVQVRCYGIHTSDKTQIPTEALPWARVVLPTTAVKSASLNLWEGTLVYGVFLDGTSYQQPLVLGIIETYDDVNNNAVGFNDPRETPVITKPEEDPITKRTNSISSYADKSLYEKTVASKLKEQFILNEYEEPLNQAAAEYPYNDVRESESGHVIEVDDTVGAERVHIFHRSGTFIELLPNGDCVHKSINDDHSIVIKNKYTATGGDEIANVGGSTDTTINGDTKKLVSGSTDTTIDGDVKKSIGGNYDLEVSGGVNIKVSGDANIKVDGNVTEDVGGNYDIKAGGVFSIKATVINLN